MWVNLHSGCSIPGVIVVQHVGWDIALQLEQGYFQRAASPSSLDTRQRGLLQVLCLDTWQIPRASETFGYPMHRQTRESRGLVVSEGAK